MRILNPTCIRLQFFMEASAASQSFPCKIWELLVDAFNKRRQTEVTNLSCTWEVLTSCQMSNSSTSIQKSNFTERAARFIMLARLTTWLSSKAILRKTTWFVSILSASSAPSLQTLLWFRVKGSCDQVTLHLALCAATGSRGSPFGSQDSSSASHADSWSLPSPPGQLTTSDDMKPWIGVVQLLRIWVCANARHHSS